MNNTRKHTYNNVHFPVERSNGLTGWAFSVIEK